MRARRARQLIALTIAAIGILGACDGSRMSDPVAGLSDDPRDDGDGSLLDGGASDSTGSPSDSTESPSDSTYVPGDDDPGDDDGTGDGDDGGVGDDPGDGDGGGEGDGDDDAPPAWGLPGDGPSSVETFPKLATLIGSWDAYSPVDQDRIARFDLISLAASPPTVADIRGRNPSVTLYYRVMPQAVAARAWGRSWSWMDVVRDYCEKNDWILRHDTGGEAIAKGWGGYWRWGDFTSRCPEGTYFDPELPELDSRGLRLADWMARRFVPWFVSHRMVGYDGLWWEVVVQRANSYWWHDDTPGPDGGYLDWDRNGVADVVEGGAAAIEAFRDDWRATTNRWMLEVRARLGARVPIIGGGDAFAPPLANFEGFKNEDFLHRNRSHGPRWDWWDEFYSSSPSHPRRGYVYQRDRARAGWSLSINQVQWSDDASWSFSDPVERDRVLRLAFGTTLLGDGYFCYLDYEHPIGSHPRVPWVPELYERRLGTHAYPFERYVSGRDTLYTRYFHDGTGRVTGFVAVNPNDRSIEGIPPEDALIEVYE